MYNKRISTTRYKNKKYDETHQPPNRNATEEGATTHEGPTRQKRKRKKPGKPLWTQKPITSWVKSLAHRDEAKTPGLIWAKYVEYIRQKWKEHQNDQIMLHTCKSINKLKTTKTMPFGITSRQKISTKNRQS